MVDWTGLAVLQREECMALLATATVGRIGVSVDALPVILPVDFTVLDDLIVLRNVPRTKLSAAVKRRVVAFQADDFD
jgi:nitroimidazol reductase NimA-like FMN-containing flavoprotein (pyridoxamine 5'-phosphate oxidase superfamily)